MTSEWVLREEEHFTKQAGSLGQTYVAVKLYLNNVD